MSSPTLSLVPTPSVPDTRIGSTKPAAFRSNSPAKPPSSALHPGGKKKKYNYSHGYRFTQSFSLGDFLAHSLVFVHENEDTRAGRRLGQRLDHVHQLVAGSDVHSAVLIGKTSVRDAVKY